MSPNSNLSPNNRPMRDDILRSVAQQIGCVSRKPFQNMSCDATLPLPVMPLQTLDSDFDLDVEAFFLFTDLLSSSEFAFLETDLNTLRPDLNFPSIGGYMLLCHVSVHFIPSPHLSRINSPPRPIYVAAITRVSLPAHRLFDSNILTYIGEMMGVRQGSNMAAFLQAHPFFLGQREGCGGVSEDIIGWAKVMPIRPMRDLFEAERKERELLRRGGEMLDHSLEDLS